RRVVVYAVAGAVGHPGKIALAPGLRCADGLALGVGDRGAVAGGVVAVGGGLAQGVDHLGQAISVVVVVGCQVAVGVGDRLGVPLGVVGVGGGVIQEVVDD